MGRKDISGVEGVRSQGVAENGSDLDIRRLIFTVRGVQVMLDRDLVELYKVPTKRLNEQVKRNAERFPAHFMFRLSAEDLSLLRSQFATSKRGWVVVRVGWEDRCPAGGELQAAFGR